MVLLSITCSVHVVHSCDYSSSYSSGMYLLTRFVAGFTALAKGRQKIVQYTKGLPYIVFDAPTHCSTLIDYQLSKVKSRGGG